MRSPKVFGCTNTHTITKKSLVVSLMFNRLFLKMHINQFGALP